MIIRDYYLGDQEVDLDEVKLLLCDIDGTVADLTHRLHWIKTKPKNWDAFAKTIHLDVPINWVVNIVNKFHYNGAKVVMCSGRNEDYKKETRDWLYSYGVLHNDLYMRKSGDYRDDAIVKKELLDEIRKEYGEPDLVLDDRTRVVEMWRNEGIRCIQVNFGDF